MKHCHRKPTVSKSKKSLSHFQKMLHPSGGKLRKLSTKKLKKIQHKYGSGIFDWLF